MPRDPLDRYYTPDALAQACLRVLIEWLVAPPDVLLEPCSGGGAFGRAGQWAGVKHVLGCDVDPEAGPNYPCERVAVADWAPVIPAKAGARPDVWIVTNPHYSGVYDTVATMRDLQRKVGARLVGLLLRATTIEQLMNREDPPHLLWVSDLRPRWGGPGGADLTSGDTCGSVFAVWGRQPLVTQTTIRGMPAWRAKGRSA